MAPYSLDDHNTAVQALSSEVTSFHASSTPFRINHGSTNSTRVRDPNAAVLNISHLQNIISLDTTSNTAVVEPNVPLDALLTATLKYGLMPPVVMEFPGITVGGGFSGASGESTCWREGLFDCCINDIELITGDGNVVRAEKNGVNQDLFNAARCTLGTMGVVTLLTIRLVEAKPYVEVTFHRTSDVAELVNKVTQLCEEHLEKKGMDFIEAIIYSKKHGMIITGRHASVGSNRPSIQRFDRAWDPWFYQYARDAKHGKKILVPTQSYLFRHDRGAFWSGETFFNYSSLPNNKFTRAAFNSLLKARPILKSTHANNGAELNIVQDLVLPVNNSEKFVDYVADELNIFPIWVCPIRKKPDEGNVWGWPCWKSPTKPPPSGDEPHKQKNASASDGGELMLNFGVWGVRSEKDSFEFHHANRRMEAQLRELHGMKVLYAQAWYTNEEFWAMYDKEEYDRLRSKWNAQGLPNIWEKIRRKELAPEPEDNDGNVIEQ